MQLSTVHTTVNICFKLGKLYIFHYTGSILSSKMLKKQYPFCSEIEKKHFERVSEVGPSLEILFKSWELKRICWWRVVYWHASTPSINWIITILKKFISKYLIKIQGVQGLISATESRSHRSACATLFNVATLFKKCLNQGLGPFLRIKYIINFYKIPLLRYYMAN